MSVTFSIESRGTGTFRFACYAGDTLVEAGPFPSRAAGQEALQAHSLDCSECRDIYRPGVYEIPDVEMEMNVSNSNAAMIFDRLDIEDADWCGAMDADKFLGHVLVALGLPSDDSGIPTVEHQNEGPSGPTGPRMIFCGLPAGYFTARLTRLSEIACEAKRLGRQVTWG